MHIGFDAELFEQGTSGARAGLRGVKKGDAGQLDIGHVVLRQNPARMRPAAIVAFQLTRPDTATRACMIPLAHDLLKVLPRGRIPHPDNGIARERAPARRQMRQ
ncbi:MAG: hypothetical protein ABI128_12000 [Rhodanobacter sp.]